MVSAHTLTTQLPRREFARRVMGALCVALLFGGAGGTCAAGHGSVNSQERRPASPAAQALAPFPADSVQGGRDLVSQLLGDQRLTEALAIQRRIVLSSPHNQGEAITLADLYGWTGDYDHAIALYKDVVQQDAENMAALKGLARVMRWSARYAEAESCYNRALKVEGGDIDALLGLALTHAQEKNFAGALRVAAKADELSPHNPEIMRTRGDILAWANQFSAAEQTYRAVLDMNPRSAEVYRSLGDLYRWIGQYTSAVEAFARANEIEPRNTDILISLADAAIDAGHVLQADEALRKVFALDPHNPSASGILLRLQARNTFDYAALLDGYAKPAVLVLSNLAIAGYFWRRKDRLKNRGIRFLTVAYRVWPLLAVGWVLLFAVSKVTGIVRADLVTETAEFATMMVWMLAFVTLVYDTRTVRRDKPQAVLAIGAHPDDIELGCGGTLSRYKELGFKVYGLVVTSGEAGNPYTNERYDRQREAEYGASILGLDRVWIYHFRDTQLYSQVDEIKAAIEEKIRQTGAHVIITQSPHDIHQDHKAVFEATKIAARGDRTILCYEDVSTEANFAANYYVDISDFLEDKIRAVQAHRTQRGKPYMHPEQISGRAAHRGLQTGVRYAEAFLLYRGLDLWKSS